MDFITETGRQASYQDFKRYSAGKKFSWKNKTKNVCLEEFEKPCTPPLPIYCDFLHAKMRDDVIAFNRPSSIAEILHHQFFEPETGTMAMQVVLKHIHALLNDRRDRKRSSKKVMICFAAEDTEFAVTKLALILAPEVGGLSFEGLGTVAAATAGTGGVVTMSSSYLSTGSATHTSSGGGSASRSAGTDNARTVLSGGGDGRSGGGTGSVGGGATAGDDEAVEDMVAKCDIVIAVVSDAFVASKQCGAALDAAARFDKYVLPIACSSSRTTCLSQWQVQTPTSLPNH